MIPEEIQNYLIDRLTIRTFNEEFKSVFPYIYKFIDESEIDVVELGADDLLAEAPTFADVGKMKLPSGNMNQEYQAKLPFAQKPHFGLAGNTSPAVNHQLREEFRKFVEEGA
jgi:hypothetical protein